MGDDSFARVLAGLLCLPEWLPKAILRTATAILFGAVVVAPDTARQAFQIYSTYETERITDLVGDLLDHRQVPHSLPSQ